MTKVGHEAVMTVKPPVGCTSRTKYTSKGPTTMRDKMRFWEVAYSVLKAHQARVK